MSERLIEKLDRFGAEAGIKEMTPEIRRFAMLVRNDMLQVDGSVGAHCFGGEAMRYEQAKPLVEKLMNLAVLYHGAPSMLRHKLYETLDEYLPDLDEGCRERGCIAVDHLKDNLDNMSAMNKRPLKEYP